MSGHVITPELLEEKYRGKIDDDDLETLKGIARARIERRRLRRTMGVCAHYADCQHRRGFGRGRCPDGCEWRALEG